jgi:uncharacterized protein YbcC (UPF0753/DUF2309 family)
MTPTELLEHIEADKEKLGWLLEETFSVNISLVNFKQEFKGLYSYYEFIYQQAEGFEGLNFLANCLEEAKNEFVSIKERIIETIESYDEIWRVNHDSYYGNSRTKRILKTELVIDTIIGILYDTKELILLNDIAQKYSETAATAALKYLIRYIDIKETIKGEELIRDYFLDENPLILSEIEKTEYEQREQALREQLSRSEELLQKHILKYEKHALKVDEIKNEKEQLFSTWFDTSKNNHTAFDIKAKKAIKKLEETYETKFQKLQTEYDTRNEQLETLYKEKLKLSEPAQYWTDRAADMRKQGKLYVKILAGLIGVVVLMLGSLMWFTPEQIYISFFDDDKSAAIRWSIIYISFVSFLAYAIRAVTKVMFSSFHLARDSDERHTLTYFYLSLLKDENNELDKEEKQLIMQSLFSRADTGLLKEDSSPTMPNDIIGKLFK